MVNPIDSVFRMKQKDIAAYNVMEAELEEERRVKKENRKKKKRKRKREDVVIGKMDCSALKAIKGKVGSREWQYNFMCSKQKEIFTWADPRRVVQNAPNLKREDVKVFVKEEYGVDVGVAAISDFFGKRLNWEYRALW